MKIKTQRQMSDDEIMDQVHELCQSKMLVEFGSFVGDKGDTVFSCKIKDFSYDGSVREHAKGFGANPAIAFTQAYERLNKL